MSEYDYYVDIRKTGTKKNTEITGNLTCTFCEYGTNSGFPFIPEEKNFSLKFNPLTILGDLRKVKQPHEYSSKRLDMNTLFDSYEYEYGFEKPLYIGNDEQYLKFISNLDKIIRDNQCKTLQDLKLIQRQYNLNLDYKISEEKNNNSKELLQSKKCYAPERIYKPLEYKYGEINKVLEKNTYMNKNHQFSYHCYTMADVIFSILHFIVIHQYEFKTCALCQKRYAKIPNNGQGKYCSRKSPLGLNSYFDESIQEKFINLDCQASMKKFQEIKKNKKKNLLTYAPTFEQEEMFINKFDTYNETIKKSPTVKNLIALYSFIKQYKFDT